MWIRQRRRQIDSSVDPEATTASTRSRFQPGTALRTCSASSIGRESRMQPWLKARSLRLEKALSQECREDTHLNSVREHEL